MIPNGWTKLDNYMRTSEAMAQMIVSLIQFLRCKANRASSPHAGPRECARPSAKHVEAAEEWKEIRRYRSSGGLSQLASRSHRAGTAMSVRWHRLNPGIQRLPAGVEIQHSRCAIVTSGRKRLLPGAMRWTPLVGQFGGLDKLGSGCRQAAKSSIPDAQYVSSGVRPASVECGRLAL